MTETLRGFNTKNLMYAEPSCGICGDTGWVLLGSAPTKNGDNIYPCCCGIPPRPLPEVFKPYETMRLYCEKCGVYGCSCEVRW